MSLHATMCYVTVYSSPQYRLLAVDLTNDKDLANLITLAGMNPHLPTLVVSEVVLCYLQDKRYTELMVRWSINGK